VLCTGIEYDHADIYPDLAAVQRSFEKLVKKTSKGWVLVEDASAPKPAVVAEIANLVKAAGKKLLRYGFDSKSEVQILSIEDCAIPGSRARGSRCTFRLPGFDHLELVLPMSGRHNVLNLCGVLGVLDMSGKLRGLTPTRISALLLGFKGIKRRQEELFADDRLIVIDDFAHHPTAIRETIDAIRKRYPGNRLYAFFEARSATSARNVFLNEFGLSFQGADEVFLVPPTKSNVPQAEKLDIAEVARRVSESGTPVFVESDVAQLGELFLQRLQKNASTKAVALVMSNGAFGGMHQKIIARWKELQG